MPPTRKAGPRRTEARQQQASSFSSAAQVLDHASHLLDQALRANIRKACRSDKQFCGVMEPAQALMKLLPKTADDSRPLIQEVLQNLAATRFRALEQLLVALAWSASVVVPTSTPAGMQPSLALQMWGEVAVHCAAVITAVLPATPGFQQLVPGVLTAGQDAGLPAPSQWMATLAATLVPLVEAPGEVALRCMMRLAASLVALWGACCNLTAQVEGGPDTGGPAWGVVSAHHMQHLLHALCRRPAVLCNDAWVEWQLDAGLASFLRLWQRTCRHGLAPPQVEGFVKKQDSGAAGAAGCQPQAHQQQQEGWCQGPAGMPPRAVGDEAGGAEGARSRPGAEELQLMTAALLQHQGFWWSLLATLCGLHHAWVPVCPKAAPTPRAHPLLAYPAYISMRGKLHWQDSSLIKDAAAVGRCLCTLLRGWTWSLWPAQLQAMYAWQQAAAAAAAAGEAAALAGSLAAGAPVRPPADGMQQTQRSNKTNKEEDGVSDVAGQDDTVQKDQDQCSTSGNKSVCGTSPCRLLWPLLPGTWSRMTIPASSSANSCTSNAAAPAAGGGSSSSSSSSSRPDMHHSKPTLQELQVALEGLLRERRAQVTGSPGATSSGLLLLAILLSAADPPVRLAFLAGVPGEVLLRLLGDVMAKGVVDERCSPAKPLSNPRIFWQWQAAGAGSQGALGLAAALAQERGLVRAVPTRQAVLQVLLWCFFEVVPPQQQQQEEEEEEQQQQQQQQQQEKTCSSDSTTSSRSRSSHQDSNSQDAQHVQRLLLAARQGVMWVPSADSDLALPLLALPASWVALVPGYTPSPLLLLLLEQLGQGLGEEEEQQQGHEAQQQQQQQQPQAGTTDGVYASTWWEVTLQVLSAAVEAGLEAADSMAAADDPDPSGTGLEAEVSEAAPGTTTRHLVPSPAALPFWAPLSELARRFATFTSECLSPQQQGDPRLRALGTQMLQATVEARYHPTDIAQYVVHNRSSAADPWALYTIVSCLGVTLGRLEQQVGVYAALAAEFAAGMEALPPASYVRGTVGSYCGSVPGRLADLVRGMHTARSNHTALMQSWGLGQLGPAGEPQLLHWRDMDSAGGAAHQEAAHEAVANPSPQQQHHQVASAAAEESTGSRRAAKRAQQRQEGRPALRGCTPIRWLTPGAKAVFTWGRNPPAQPPAPGLPTPATPAFAVVVSSAQEWRLCTQASEVLDAMDALPRWYAERQAIWVTLKHAWGLRVQQMGTEVPQQQQQQQHSRRSREPPLDPAKVLAAARACFGSLEEAAELLLWEQEEPGAMGAGPAS